MHNQPLRQSPSPPTLPLILLGVVALMALACGGDDGNGSGRRNGGTNTTGMNTSGTNTSVTDTSSTSTNVAGGTQRVLECDAWKTEDGQLTDLGPGVDYVFPADCGTIQISKTLTIDPGVVIAFHELTDMLVNESGKLLANGTKEKPIILQGTTNKKGHWDGLRVASVTTSELKFVQIKNAGIPPGGQTLLYPAALYLSGPARVDMQDCLIEGSGANGVDVSRSINSLKWERNTITGSDAKPLSISPPHVTALDKESSFSGNKDDRIELYSGDVRGEQTWKNLGVPYLRQELSIVVREDSGLILEPGVTILFGAGTALVAGDGYISAKGTEAEKIVLRGIEDDVTGQWAGVAIYTADRKNALEHVKVMHAGGSELNHNITAAILLPNDAYMSLKNSEVSMSGNHGLYMRHHAAEIDFEKNVFTKNEKEPIFMAPEYVTELDKESSYTGNTKDFVLVGNGSVEGEATWRALDVPYRLAKIILDYAGVTISEDASLTIEAGAELNFGPEMYLVTEKSGYLAIKGEASKKVTLQGETQVPKAWGGIGIGGASLKNEIEHAVIAHTGKGNGLAISVKGSATLKLKDVELKTSSPDSACLIEASSGATITEEGTNTTDAGMLICTK